MDRIPKNPKICVIQRGARHRYEIPRIIHDFGYLQRFVTDSHSESLLGRACSVVDKIIELPPLAKRLLQRVIFGVPEDLIYCTDRWVWVEKKLRVLSLSSTSDWLKERDKAWFNLTKDTLSEETDIIYVMGGENLALLKQARDKGVKIIVDAFINPINLRQTFEAKIEENLKPTLEEVEHKLVEAHYKSIFDLSDIIVCPSNWVAEGVLHLSATYQSRIRICPYGSSLKTHKAKHLAIPGRIFWAGTDWFRKGLHHLAAAADILKPKYPNMDFRIAGITDPKVIEMDRFRNLNFLGKLDRKGMECEFSRADLFAFPTLSEGMASVLVESISFGCPVITTSGAGIDGLEDSGAGKIVPMGDHTVLATTILDLFNDRLRLEEMSRACAIFAHNFTSEAWAVRLKKTINEVIS